MLTVTCVIAGILVAPCHAEIIDKIIATVDDEVILRSDIEFSVLPFLEDLRLTAKTEQEFAVGFDELIKTALEENIETKLLYRKAQLEGMIDISDEQVEAQVERWRKAQEYATLQEFVEDLKENGQTVSEFKEGQRKRIMANAMSVRKMREFRADVSVSESQMAEYYEEHRSYYTRPERIQLRQIFLKKMGKSAVANAQIRTRLESLKIELENGADFEDLARAHSQALGAEEGGKFQLGDWVMRADLNAVLEEAAFALPPGGVSHILEDQFGFRLLKVVKKEEEESVPFEEARTHIEKAIQDFETAKKYKRWIDILRKESGVRIFL
jgi:peptidyl-prolyl cis-trans isomerase SurA